MIKVPDHPPLFYRGYGRGATPHGPGGGVSQYTITKPEKEGHLTFRGPVWERCEDNRFLLEEPPVDVCEIDVTFTGVAPLWDMKGSSVEAATQIGSLHTEQIGCGSGSVKYKGKTYVLDNSYAIRDHSRGVRDMTHFGAHAWLNGRFSSGRSFHVYAARAQGQAVGELGMSNAVIFEGQKQYDAKVLAVELLTSTDISQSSHTLSLESDLGIMNIKITKPIDSFPYFMVMPFDTTVNPVKSKNCATMIDEAVHMEWEGLEGVGWSERGIAEHPL
ncbi:MAG: hypothetical protein COA43_00915 [Robiginitomaculum sp.]|nr:MAG: hypothetical protein COA43_00915 [Robiginitomaculum sp.]